MAKSENATQDAVVSALQKTFGKNSVGTAEKIGFLSVVKYGLPSGIPALDLAIGRNGLPFGRIVEVYGEETHGKSTLSMILIREAQRRGYVAALMDAESGFDPVWAEKIGVDLERLLFLQTDEEKEGAVPIMIEDAFSRIFTLIKTIKTIPEDQRVPIVVVWDSIGGTMSKAEFDRDPEDKGYAGATAPITANIKKLSALVSREKVLPIIINQVRDNVGIMYGDKLKTPGGHALKHFATLRMWVKRVGWESVKEGSVTRHIGQKHKVGLKKNKVSSPGREADFSIFYEEGIDRTSAMLDGAIAIGWVDKSGRTYTLADTGDKFTKDKWPEILESRFGGIDNFYDTWLEKACEQNLLIPYGQGEESV